MWLVVKKQTNGKPVFTSKDCGVFECKSEEGKTYYTIVNFKLNVHRHSNRKSEAIELCKNAGKMYIASHYDEHFKKQLRYLIFGDIKYK